MPKTARVGRKKATVLDLLLSHLRLRPRGAYTGSKMLFVRRRLTNGLKPHFAASWDFPHVWA